jgi:hypothetical protein
MADDGYRDNHGLRGLLTNAAAGPAGFGYVGVLRDANISQRPSRLGEANRRGASLR